MQAPAGPIQNEKVLTNFNLLAAATVNANLIAAAPGVDTLGKAQVRRLYNAVLTNYAAAVRFVKFYDKATAPTVGTDLPKIVIQLAAGQTIPLYAGELGIREFTLGLGIGITVLGVDSDTTAVTAGDVRVDLNYF